MARAGIVYLMLGVSAALCAPIAVDAADAPPTDPEFDQILSLDLPDLNVTSVSKREEKLTDTAAAVYVLTQNDIRRGGATNIPDALRMVPGLQVARVSSNRWAISARGFNGPLANKLLVMIDGRSIYTPVFSGTYWDDQSTPVQDIDRIEVIRGPGASIWGSNAVNGVINIITKSAEKTQGNMISATGSPNGALLEGRHGGKLKDGTYYRGYATYFDSAGSLTNQSNTGNWDRTKAGFRLDKSLAEGNSYSLQGDAYAGNQNVRSTLPLPSSPFSRTVERDDTSYGGNVLGKWNRRLSADSNLALQASVDHYARLEANFEQRVTTADVQMQNSRRLNDRNNFIWGGGARVHYDDLSGTYSVSVRHPQSTHEVINTFVQNEYAVIPDTAYLTVGSKFEYNDYTGIEVEPSVRGTWHPAENQTVWASVSRAVRIPSTVEEDINLVASVQPGTPPTELRAFGNPDQESEELIAYELGHRIQASRNLSFDTALYWNDFEQLQTVGAPGATFVGTNGNLVQPYILNNLGSGHVYGAEIVANWRVTPTWRLMGNYTYSKMDLDVSPGTAVTLDATEGLNPRHQFSVRSYYDIRDDLHWDNMLYYVDGLRAPVGSYVRYDSRVAWLVRPGIELSLIGRNLTDNTHYEFPTTPQTEIRRTVVGQVLWKF